MLRTVSFALVVALAISACGGNGTPAPTPTPTPVPTNHPPEIVVATIGPPNGLVWLTTFTAHAEARDADGDALTFAWKTEHGIPVTGTASNGGADIAFVVTQEDEENGLTPFTLTVTDGKGGSSSVKVAFAWRLLRGSLVGAIGAQPFSIGLDQDQSTVIGQYLDGLANGRDDCEGTSDTSEPGTIDAPGNFRVRFKCKQNLGNIALVGQYTADFRLIGTADGAGFRGEPFEFHPIPYEP
jgi:hypothetical protein